MARRALAVTLTVLASITVLVAGHGNGARTTGGEPATDTPRTKDGQSTSRLSRGLRPGTLPSPRQAPIGGTDTSEPTGVPEKELDEEDLGPGKAPEDNGDGDVEHLRPELKQALAAARADAQKVGLTILVNSGWRSAGHQAQLYQEAIAKYGSPEKARRWVLPPEESHHVTGEAIDVGPAEAAAWLEANGARHNLCRIYANEPWHFELRALTAEGACPPLRPHA